MNYAQYPTPEQMPSDGSYLPQMMGYPAYGYPMYGMSPALAMPAALPSAVPVGGAMPLMPYAAYSGMTSTLPPGLTPVQNMPQDPDGATHPCERVFGVCKGGDTCLFKNAPRSACVSYLKGRCRFGTRCRENHVSIFEGKYVPALHPCFRIFGSCKFGEQCEYANLPSSSCIKFLRGKCAFGDRCKEHHPGAMPPVGTDGVAGTPWTGEGPPPGGEGSAVVSTGGMKRGREDDSEDAANMKKQNLATGLHPCVRVFGTCHAGTTCQFAMMPSEACLRFLKGSCKFGDGCREQHLQVPGRTGSHPCVRIYGFCQNNPCQYADYPIESCLQFLKGRCKFGDICRELHPAREAVLSMPTTMPPMPTATPAPAQAEQQ